MAFRDTLANAVSQNNELLYTLRQTDYAPPALRQNTSYIAGLKSHIGSTDQELQRLGAITSVERREHEKIRDSVVRRYLHKMGGSKGEAKFASKQEKEEREFLEAWQREREAKERHESLSQALQQAKQQKQTLEHDKASHDQAQRQLDEMYNAIFSGPTPDVPGEDQKEQVVFQRRDFFERCQMQINTEKAAGQALERASGHMQRALGDIADSLSASNVDRFGGGMMFDMMERSALSKAQVNLTECLRAMDDASRSQPAIQPLTQVNIDEGHMLSDVLFDGMFADIKQHERIKSSQYEMQRAMDQLQNSIRDQQQRVQGAQGHLQEAADQLEAARKDLQNTRSESFSKNRQQS